MKRITLDGKMIGVLQNKTIGYFNSVTPDSPFSNFYQPQKPLELYWANGRLDYVKQKNAKTLKFDSVEQVFAYGKAVTMGDKASAFKIIHTHTNKPSTFKYLGRQVKNFDPAKWDKAAGKWMKLGMLAKFSQDDFAKRALIKTEGYKLGECNPYDKKWGLGVNINSNFDQALGQNKQGQLLMLVRDELQRKGQLTKQKAVQYQGDSTKFNLENKKVHGAIHPARTVNNVVNMNKESSIDNFASKKEKGNVFSNLKVPASSVTTYETIQQPDVVNRKSNNFSFR